jgi:hypothetical protein
MRALAPRCEAVPCCPGSRIGMSGLLRRLRGLLSDNELGDFVVRCLWNDFFNVRLGVVWTPVYDLLGLGFTDPGQSIELSLGGGIDVEQGWGARRLPAVSRGCRIGGGDSVRNQAPLVLWRARLLTGLTSQEIFLREALTVACHQHVHPYAVAPKVQHGRGGEARPGMHSGNCVPARALRFWRAKLSVDSFRYLRYSFPLGSPRNSPWANTGVPRT